MVYDQAATIMLVFFLISMLLPVVVAPTLFAISRWTSYDPVGYIRKTPDAEARTGLQEENETASSTTPEVPRDVDTEDAPGTERGT